MATRTLLEMTQDVLSRMSSDEVNSISDTTESLQIANIIKNKYYDIVARGDLTANKEPYQLNPSNDDTMPVLMFVPDGVIGLEWLKYFDTNPTDSQGEDQFGHGVNEDLEDENDDDIPDVPAGYKYVTILPVQQFLDMVHGFNPSESNVGSFPLTVKGQSFTFYYKNNHQPRYCTIIENNYIVFDMYDMTQDTTLQASKTMGYGQTVTPFEMLDNFVPDIDDNQFPLLFNESLAVAFYELKQSPNQKAEQEVKRQWSVVQKNKSVDNKPGYFDQLPSFGRMPRTGGYGGFTYGPRLFS